MQVLRLQTNNFLAAGPPSAKLQLVCDQSIRPVQATPQNSYGFLLLGPDQTTQLAYAEVLYFHKRLGSQLLPGSPSEAVLVLLCAKSDGFARELATAVQSETRAQGITTLFAEEPQRPQAPVAAGVVKPDWRPRKFDREWTLADGTSLFRGSRQDLAYLRPCAENLLPSTEAYVQLSADSSRPLAYFETSGRTLTHMCGDLVAVLPVVKQVFALEERRQIELPASLVFQFGQSSPSRLGFRQAGDSWLLDLQQQQQTASESARAEAYVRGVYKLVCAVDKDSNRRLENLVELAPEEDLRKFLQSKQHFLRPSESAREVTLRLLRTEAQAYCVGGTGLAIGVALAQLLNKNVTQGSLQTGLVAYAKTAMNKLLSSLSFLSDKLGRFSRGSLQLLQSVFKECMSSTGSPGVCTLGLTYLCKYVRAIVADLREATVAAKLAVGVAALMSSGITVMAAALTGLCHLVPNPSPSPGADARPNLSGGGPDLVMTATCLQQGLSSSESVEECETRLRKELNKR